jgi:hypothetical protein
MIRTARVIFCDNEHGFGDVSFPDPPRVDMEGNFSADALRREAKKAGWSRDSSGRDWCELCTESNREFATDVRNNKAGRKPERKPDLILTPSLDQLAKNLEAMLG